MRHRLWLSAIAVLIAALSAAGPAASSAEPTMTVVALVGEAGIEVLHTDFETVDGRDAPLPPSVRANAVRVRLPSHDLPYEERLARMLRGPLGDLKPHTLYYIRGTRLLIWTGALPAGRAALSGPDAFHGTGTASLVGGRTVGTAPQSLLLVTLDYAEASWSWVAAQPWVDLASSSVIDLITAAAPVFCDSARAVASFRRSGRLPYYIAGNDFFETLAYSPGHTVEAIRVGGVHTDGTPYQGQASSNFSGHGYDLAEAWTNRVALAGSDREYAEASGTSGSTPRVAGRAANLLTSARRLLGDRGTGARKGALAVAGQGGQIPGSGPLADGRLTADELLTVQLVSARPSGSVEAGRYALEGYGWFDAGAERAALDVLKGLRPSPQRTLDHAAHQVALGARAAFTSAKGCTLPPP